MNSVVKGIILIIVAAVIVVGVMYFTSDVKKTQIDAAYNQYAHWTPENIAKDPENYLNFCQKEAEKALMNLKASEIAIAQNRGNLENMKQEATAKINAGEKVVAELKDLFKQAEANSSWPITYKGQPRDVEWTKRQIVSLHHQVEGQKGLVARTEDGLKRLEVQMLRVQEGRTQAQQQVEEIKVARQTLKVDKITKELTDRLVSIKSVLQATISTAAESTGPISLEQLVAEEATTVDESEFQSIMGN